MDISGVCPTPLSSTTANTLLSVVQALFAATCTLDPSHSYQDDYGPFLETGDVFDFIVIGAGTAGSVVANRLSENPDWNILLVESGGLPTADTEVPAFSASVRFTDMVHQYQTEPSPYSCRGFIEGRCPSPCGNVLGGTSSINDMMYIRGSDEDYNYWESKGNSGWNWTTALKYFIKSENLLTKGYGNPSLHGFDGYLSTTFAKPETKLRMILLNAASETGYKIYKDETPKGFFEALSTIEHGKRCSSSKAFLSKIKTRSNLQIALKALATKIIFSGGRAQGVQINLDGRTIAVRASKEIIISAGAIGSPKLLMLSGIGPREHLQNFGIEVLRDLPVGRHLQDHVGALGVIVKMDSIGENPTKLDNIKASYQYLMENSGPLAGVDVTNLIWFFNTKDDFYPNIQTFFFRYGIQDKIFIPVVYNTTIPVTYKSLTNFNRNSELINIAVTLLTPKSKGKIELKSADPNHDPLIYGNYLKSPQDIEALVKSIDKVRQFLRTPTMRKYNAEFIDLKIPECEGLTFNTREYWTCNIQNLAMGFFHPVGTCRMGRAGVVNERLKVHGISRLRVIDASIMPKIVRGNTYAPVVMIGEKGADLIKEDWGFPIE